MTSSPEGEQLRSSIRRRRLVHLTAYKRRHRVPAKVRPVANHLLVIVYQGIFCLPSAKIILEGQKIVERSHRRYTDVTGTVVTSSVIVRCTRSACRKIRTHVLHRAGPFLVIIINRTKGSSLWTSRPSNGRRIELSSLRIT